MELVNRACRVTSLALAVAVLLVGAAIQRSSADGTAAAFAVPPLLGVATPIWLVGDGFTPGEVVTITLADPIGKGCGGLDLVTSAQAFTADFLGVAQATVAPASCSNEQGNWAATFHSAVGETISTTFTFPP